MRLQRAIQERLDQIEKVKNEEQKRQLEGEVHGLQSRNTVVEQLMQTEDNLHFLQVRPRDSCRHFIFSLSATLSATKILRINVSAVSTEICAHRYISVTMMDVDS